MTLTKEAIVNIIHKHLGLPQIKSIEMVETTLEIMKKTLESGEDVLISGFGKFHVRKKSERMGRNPNTGEDVPSEAKRVITFRCSPLLREQMNRNSWGLPKMTY